MLKVSFFLKMTWTATRLLTPAPSCRPQIPFCWIHIAWPPRTSMLSPERWCWQGPGPSHHRTAESRQFRFYFHLVGLQLKLREKVVLLFWKVLLIWVVRIIHLLHSSSKSGSNTSIDRLQFSTTCERQQQIIAYPENTPVFKV